MSGRRPMAPDERREIRRTGYLLLLAGSVSALAAAGGFVAFLFALAAMSPDQERSPGWAALLLLGLAGVSVLLLAAMTGLGRGARLLGDVAQGSLQQYAERRRGTVVRRFELLPRSGRVWSLDDARLEGWVSAAPREVADLPAFAGLAAQWVEPVSAPDGTVVHVNQRSLSEAERGELLRARRKLCLRPMLLAALLTGWCLTVLLACALTGSFPAGHNGVSLVLLAAATVLCDLNAARTLRLGWRLGRDLRLGRVGIIRRPGEAGGDAAGGVLGEPMEVLPHSGLLWSRAGEPAPWRCG